MKIICLHNLKNAKYLCYKGRPFVVPRFSLHSEISCKFADNDLNDNAAGLLFIPD